MVFTRKLPLLFAIALGAMLTTACGDDDPPAPPADLCGNGVTDPGEQCDDGNTVDGDGCNANCRLPICGDGVMEGRETCDDGNSVDDDACSNDCTVNGVAEVCDSGTDDDGDGAVDCDDTDCADDAACASSEDCTDGVDNDDDGDVDCDDSDCAANAACEGVENCTDGADNDDDGDIDCDDADCDDSAACASTEDCTDGADNDDDGDIDCDDSDCDGDDACSAVCGDGEVGGDEECDAGEDNSDTDADACRTDCTNATCGDAVVDTDEDCDGGDGCNDDCTLATVCGDGEVEGDEECDNGTDNSDTDADACRTDCTNPTCGDNVVDEGEDCDGGDDCNDDCTLDAFCGNGVVEADLDEECDDGIENSDLIPDVCRATCVLPACGDFVVDTGEECDLGDENGPDAECTAECTLNLAVACEGVELILLAEDGTSTDTGVRFNGSFGDGTADYAPTVGCIDEEEVSGNDFAFVFVPDADGDYRVTTNRRNTSADTIVYTIDGCTDPVPGDCNDDDGGAPGSTIYLTGALAGQQYFIVVDSFEGGSGFFELDIAAVAPLAAEGEDCEPADVFCQPGLVCEEDGEGALLCAADAAPVLDSIVATTDEAGNTTHTFSGTDANRDADSWFIDSVTFLDGEINADGLIPVAPPVVIWDGDAFTFDVNINWPGFAEQPAVEMTAHVIDARGNESETVTVEIPEFVEPETDLAEGADCDLLRIANICIDPFTCTLNDDDTTTCGAAVAPVLDSARTERTAVDAVEFFFDGSDVNGDVAAWNVQFFDAAGDPLLAPFVFGFDVRSTGRTTFGLRTVVTGLTVGGGFASAEVSLVDDAGLESDTITVVIPEPSLVGEGEACDGDGVETTCVAPFVCGIDGDDFICEEALAPVITFFEAEYLDLETTDTIVLYVEGFDPNGDATTLDVLVTTADGGGGTITLGPEQLIPNPFGREFFAFTSINIGTGGTFFADAQVTLIDASGLESEPANDPLGLETGLGDPCTRDGTGACDEGLTCGADDVCEEAVAPVLDSLLATRLDENTVQFLIVGTDGNGDVVNQLSTLYDADETALTAELRLILDDDISGVTDFSVTSTITGFAGFEGLEFARLRVVDAAGLMSDTLDVLIAPVVDIGGDCVGDGIGDICADGSSCVEGVCASSAPSIASVVAVQNPDNRRFLDVTVTGEDTDEDIALLTLDIFDDVGDSVFDGPLEIDPALIAEPLGIAYEGGEFTLRLQLNWDDPAFYNVTDGVASVTDSVGTTTEDFVFTFRPTVGLGDICDVEEVDAICAIGFVCDDSTLLCDVDLEDPCGGIPIIDVDEVGEFVEGEGLYVPFDSNGEDNLSEADCGAFGPSAGAEVAAFWVAPANGSLTVTTQVEATAFDTYIYARIGLCADPGAEVACNDDFDGTLQSTITFEVSLADEVYVILDGFGSGGVGEALFVFTEGAFVGESCVELDCVPGLFCDGDDICAGPGAEDDDCEFVPCEEGLFCNEDTFTCASAGLVGEDCEFVPCAADLACDSADNTCAELGGDGDDCSTVPCGPGFVCDDVDTLTCSSAASSCEDSVTIATDATTFAGVLDGALDTFETPCGLGSNERVFEWTSDFTGEVVVDTDGSDFDTVLYITVGECAAPEGDAFLGCNDDAIGLQSELLIDAVAGEVFYFFVERFGAADTGNIAGNITRVAP